MPDLAFHTGPWLTLIVVALVCLMRAYQLRRKEPDDRLLPWSAQLWAVAGLGLLVYAFMEWFNHRSQR